MTTLELLQRGRKRIAKGWIQGDNACDAKGNFTSTRSPNTVAFCAAGALRAESPPGPEHSAVAALVAELPERSFLILFNDDPKTTKVDVLALYDRAIERLT